MFISSDDEYTLYAVTVFKKYGSEFVHKIREKKWVPRDYKFIEGGKEEEVKELKRLEAEEKRVWGETLRLGRTGWSEAVMGLVHVVVLRVFVEGVLRYGLPLDVVGGLVKVSPIYSGVLDEMMALKRNREACANILHDRLIENENRKLGRA